MTTLTRNEIRAMAARMQRVAALYRARHPLSAPIWEAGSYPIAMHVNGEPEIKTMVWFPAAGCYWSTRGGCTMCNFGARTCGGSVRDSLAAFEMLVSRLDPGVRRLHIGPGGSFLSKIEVPPELRRGILHRIGQLKFLRSVGIETRPTLVTESRILEVIENLPHEVDNLVVGFGLECHNDLVREVAINKGFTLRHVEAAIRVLDKANAAQQRVRVTFEIYVLLKPLFLSEQEAIDESLRTIDWAFRGRAEAVVLFMNTVKTNTLQGYLASREDLPAPIRYEPPFYRTAIQVLRQLPDEQRRLTKVLGTQSGIVASGMPRACPLCAPLLSGSLVAHNFTGDAAILDQAARSSCQCKDKWLAELSIPREELIKRVRTALDFLEEVLAS